jgi:hypothetical protein
MKLQHALAAADVRHEVFAVGFSALISVLTLIVD